MLQLALLSLLAQAAGAPDGGALDAGALDVTSGGGPSPAEAAAPDDDRARVTVVTGSRTERLAEDSVVPTEVITRAQIEALGVRDLTQLLQQQPGVEMVYTNRGVGLRLQGMDPEYVLILVDGERVAGRSGAFTDLLRFSLREVERVEIVKGPAAALYGADAIGGVINLITRRPQKPLEGVVRGMFGLPVAPQSGPYSQLVGLDGKQSLGSLLANGMYEAEVRGNVGSKLGPFELRGGGGFRSRYAWDWDASDEALNVPSIRRIDADAEVAYAPSERLRTWIRTAYVLTDLDAKDLNSVGAFFTRYQRTEQFDAWTGVKAALGADTTLTVRGHFGYFRDQFLVDQRGAHGPQSGDDYSRNITRLWEGLGQVDHHLGRHLLTAGVEGYSELLISDRIDPQDVQRGRVGLWVQDEWVLADRGPRVAFVPGLRLDADTQFGVAPSPRLAIKVDPVPQVTARASWGLGFRPPAFSELYLLFSNPGIGYRVQGNPSLTAEHSGSVNIGVDWRLPWEGWSVSASAWHTSITNLINVSANGTPNPDDPVVFTYANVANAYTQGAELSGRMKLSRGTYLEVGYTGTDSRDLTRNRPLEGRSPHRVNAQLSSKYRPFGLEGVVRMTWASARPFYSGSGLGFANVLGFGPEQTIIAPGYVDLEAQLTYTRYFFKIFVNGSNLLNAGDASFNPRPPRGISAGVQFEL
jgi:outer membrane receptor for ferrienterochelin and colicins